MRRAFIALLLLVVVGLAAWWASRRHDAIRQGLQAVADVKIAREDLLLRNVRVKLYDESGRHYLSVFGRDTVEIRKDYKRMIMSPIRVEDLRTVPPGVLTARRGIRSIVKNVQMLEFEGDVFMRRSETETLKAEHVLLYPKESIVEVPVRCEMTTTDSVLRGDFLQTSTALKSGLVRGNVEIVHHLPPEAPGGAPKKIFIQGDVCPFDATRGVYIVRGNVRVTEDDFMLTGREVEFHAKDNLARAKGDVAVTDSEVILRCEELEYDVARHTVVATGEPKAARTIYRVASDPTTMEYTELEAAKLVYQRLGQTLDAEGGVKVVRNVLDKGKLVKDFDVKSGTLTSVFGQGNTGRSTFRTDVRMTSRTVGAQGDRAIVYEGSQNFYVIGNACAWSVDERGRKSNEVAGGKIFHDGRTDRNVVLEGVSGTFSPEGGE